MRDKIQATLPNDKHTLIEVNHPEIHIVDWKNRDKSRGVEVFERKQVEINSVCLFNDSELEIVVDAFGENALPVKKGEQESQCECIVFPSIYNENSWTLVIEMKYANDEDKAFAIRKKDNKSEDNNCENDKNKDYPEKMVSQIIKTVEYFRERNIIDNNRVVHAIISFPNLIADFNSQLFSYVRDEWSVENLLVSRRIRIKGCNSANIKSTKTLKFITD